MLKYKLSFLLKGKEKVAENEPRGNEARKIVTNKERQRRLRAVRRKKLILRTVFVLLGVVILVALIALTVTLVKAIKRIASGSRSTDKYYCSTYQLENSGGGDVVSNDSAIYILRGGVLTCAQTTGVTLWNENLGSGDFKLLPYKNGIVVYAVGGDYVRCFDEDGLSWERTDTGPVSFVTLNPEASSCIICTEESDRVSKIVYFSTKTAKSAKETLLEKPLRERYVLSAAISPAGKSIAVVELKTSDNGENAATLISVYDVSSGKGFYSNLIENEICPYCSFAGETSLVAAGRRNVYLFEKINKNDTKTVRISQLLSVGDTGDDVLCAMVTKKYVAVAVGRGDGRSSVKIFELGTGEERSFSVPRAVKGLFTCGDKAFVCITQDDFMVYDYEGNKVSACGEKIDIERIISDGSGHFAINGVYGTAIINVKKAG